MLYYCSTTPDLARRLQKGSRLRPLVRMSATISRVGQYTRVIVPLATCSRMN